MKKIIAILSALAVMFSMFTFVGCTSKYGETFDGYKDSIDVEFAKEVMTNISSFGDDPVYGMRGAGSPAEDKACNYVESVMKDIGLKNVTVDETTVDGWTFKGANIKYKDQNGEEVKADLAGFQTTIQAKDESLDLVYVGKGAKDDYEGIDVSGKLVLIQLDEDNDWWINYPAYQAKVKGARGVIAMRKLATDGEETEDRIGSNDACGPADAPALSISLKDFKAIRKVMKANKTNTIKVSLTADSKVTEDATSHNVYGEIPGTTNETIFVFGHMDGYFHSTYDDGQGVAVTLAMAKAMIDSNFVPEKTIRFCIHGAEEWGKSGSEYDWSQGAYQDIAVNHPDWVDGAFAIVNNDAGYCVEGEEVYGVMSSIELRQFTKDCMADFEEDFPSFKYQMLTTSTEEFYWTRLGIPAISAGTRSSTNYDDMGYHTNFDSFEAQPLDEDRLESTIKVFGKAVIDLNALKVRPLNFTARIKNFEKSLGDEAKDQFKDVIKEAYAAAEKLEAKMAEVEESGDLDAALKLNVQTQKVYKAFQDAILGIDLMNGEEQNKDDQYEYNIECLEGAIEALEDGDIATCVDDYLCEVDWAWYDMNFDRATTDYMKEQVFNNRKGTFGDGLVAFPHADTFDVSQSLWYKYDEEKADVSSEIAKLKELKETQEQYLAATYKAEKKGLEKAVKLMKTVTKN